MCHACEVAERSERNIRALEEKAAKQEAREARKPDDCSVSKELMKTGAKVAINLAAYAIIGTTVA